jgi:demethylmenaquinone methyltransferase/2-methoxy-6-polyprenyl-1,4-benzoquinol methylase
MLQEANKKEGLNPVCSHTELLPFPAGYFDRVIMVDALHHVCDQKETARELWRVLKPGGLIIIEEPDIRNLSVKLVALGEKVAFMRSHFLAPAEIVALFDGDPGEIDVNLDRYIARVVIKKSG